ncbi:prefoldin subunit alpha [Salinarchaeum sp. Harcht-Bsk1]|uniref:PUA domain-containing protein n=1 Tax=Salinarchaeum sp. Harcht-Bsk1 TaxID=1333523 RepID=UPI000342317E|nr:PUA domain-containing protein [Salinarchaeum sp. Harcht-Bsk1]AGN02075.1 prefoldin subunit alpha [Salinarchaeum sp. Harcht-Bsk1]
MHDEPPTPTELDRIRRVANFQFGHGGAAALFPEVGPRGTEAVGDVTITRTASGRVEQCFDDGDRLFTKETNGRFVLSVEGGRRIVEGLDAPRHRVEVGEESVEFVRDGRNAFAKFVRSVDPDLRPGDEAVVVYDGDVLGVGRAELSPDAMADFDTGVAVFVRHGAGD